MFIVHLSTGETIIENQNNITWDNVPDGISSLEIATFSGEVLTLPKCEQYFFSNEAKSSLGIGAEVSPTPILTAKIIGGIIGGKAIYIRIDTRGHIAIDYLDKKDLPFIPTTYRKGI